MNPPEPRHVVLVGLMGSGKSSVGRPLAARLGRPFVDNDAQVLAREGRMVDAIERSGGTEAVHAAEARALLAALDRTEPSVIAAAASTIESEPCRRKLRSVARVVWLHADPAELASRLRRPGHRPALGAQPSEVVAGQAATRDRLYRAAADVVVDTEDRRPGEIAAELAGRVGGSGGGMRTEDG